MAELTVDDLIQMRPGFIFASGDIPNDAEDGILMDTFEEYQALRWIASRGEGYHDWAIYISQAESTNIGDGVYTIPDEWIRKNGIKLSSEANIKKLIPCSDAAYALYRK